MNATVLETDHLAQQLGAFLESAERREQDRTIAISSIMTLVDRLKHAQLEETKVSLCEKINSLLVNL